MKTKAFTLIELLIVVATLAILAAIALPNFLETQTRAKIARVRGDLRAVSIALESYRVDYGKYPPCTGDFDGGIGLGYVTSPVAYIVGENVRDIYSGQTNGRQYSQYGYASRDFQQFGFIGTGRSAQWYFILSNGPDTKRDDFAGVVQSDDFPGFVNTIYEPTNGTISAGNIYRSGGVFEGPGIRAANFVTQYAPQYND